MRNHYEILEDLNLVIIKCRSKESTQFIEVYVDYDIFVQINTYDVEWKAWGEASGIATTYNVNGKFINLYLKKIIGEILFDEGTHVKLIDDSVYDFRKANLFSYARGYFNNREVKAAYETCRREHVCIVDILKNEERSNFISGKIRPLYDPISESIVLSKNDRIVSEISLEYANEIYTFLKANPSYLLKKS